MEGHHRTLVKIIEYRNQRFFPLYRIRFLVIFQDQANTGHACNGNIFQGDDSRFFGAVAGNGTVTVRGTACEIRCKRHERCRCINAKLFHDTAPSLLF